MDADGGGGVAASDVAEVVCVVGATDFVAVKDSASAVSAVGANTL